VQNCAWASEPPTPGRGVQRTLDQNSTFFLDNKVGFLLTWNVRPFQGLGVWRPQQDCEENAPSLIFFVDIEHLAKSTNPRPLGGAYILGRSGRVLED
jgi:hypothetical protein